jgi:5-oxoprolinase (ATP-hydrolysing) subunit A
MATLAAIDFNCDLGEGCGDDEAILPLISSASLACGFHAGGPDEMARAVTVCLAHGVAIGAHPSLPDREGFGRRELAVTPEQVHALTLYQLGALDAFVRRAGGRLHHLKPHGALYNLAARDRGLADAIAAAARDFDPRLRLYGLANSALTAAGEAAGLPVVHEVFAERRYEATGQLTPRTHEAAVIENIADAVAQVRCMVREGHVIVRTGERIPIRADTVCLHGDRPGAAAFARALRSALEAEGVRIGIPEHS